MSRKLIPAPWPVLHTARRLDPNLRNAHGNDVIVDSAPVIRYIISFAQFEYRGPMSSNQLFSAEYLQQTTTSLHMVIPAEDLDFYRSGDQVVLGGSVAGKAFLSAREQKSLASGPVPLASSFAGGVAFRVDGEPGSDLHGPWPHLYRQFGGMVKVRRIA